MHSGRERDASEPHLFLLGPRPQIAICLVSVLAYLGFCVVGRRAVGARGRAAPCARRGPGARGAGGWRARRPGRVGGGCGSVRCSVGATATERCKSEHQKLCGNNVTGFFLSKASTFRASTARRAGAGLTLTHRRSHTRDTLRHPTPHTPLTGVSTTLTTYCAPVALHCSSSAMPPTAVGHPLHGSAARARRTVTPQ